MATKKLESVFEEEQHIDLDRWASYVKPAMGEPKESPSASLLSEVPATLKESKDLLTEVVPVLDDSTHGWWRIIVIWFSVIVGVGALVVIFRYEPRPAPAPPVNPGNCIPGQSDDVKGLNCA